MSFTLRDQHANIIKTISFEIEQIVRQKRVLEALRRFHELELAKLDEQIRSEIRAESLRLEKVHQTLVLADLELALNEGFIKDPPQLSEPIELPE